MCELIGVSSPANSRVRMNSYLETFVSHSTDHPHGWGLAVFYGNAVSLEKEPTPAYDSAYLLRRLSYPLEVTNMIGHIRYATRGNMVYENCHPFVKRDVNDRAWTLAHNGTIFQSELLDTYADVQEGASDSERILCHIIHAVNELTEQLGHEPTTEERFRMMDKIILEIAEHNKLNLMVYDGETFYVHTNLKETLYCKKEGEASIFSTTPLDENGKWEPVPMMRLFGYQEGQRIFEGTEHEFEYFAP